MSGLSAIVSRRCCVALENELSRCFDELFVLPPDPLLDEPVSDHPDMILSFIGNCIVVPAEYYKSNSALIDEIADRAKRRTVLTRAPRGKKYPSDISLNALITNSFLIGKLARLAPELMREAEAISLKFIDTKQGYAACSALYASGIVITGDPSIAKAARAEGLTVIPVSCDGIRLDGYSNGFIGGCGGVVGDTVYFTGDPDITPGTEELASQLMKSGVKCIRLSPAPLVDFGGIKIIKNSK